MCPEPTTPTDVLSLLHVPPKAGSLRVTVPPAQTVEFPTIGAKAGSTVTVIVVIHPVPIVYDIIGAPTATPVITPVVNPVVARPTLLLDHDPPVVALLKVVVEPAQTSVLPVIDGTAFTTTLV